MFSFFLLLLLLFFFCFSIIPSFFLFLIGQNGPKMRRVCRRRCTRHALRMIKKVKHVNSSVDYHNGSKTLERRRCAGIMVGLNSYPFKPKKRGTQGLEQLARHCITQHRFQDPRYSPKTSSTRSVGQTCAGDTGRIQACHMDPLTAFS